MGFKVTMGNPALFEGAPDWAVRVEEYKEDNLRVWVGNGHYQYLPDYNGLVPSNRVFNSDSWPVSNSVILAERQPKIKNKTPRKKGAKKTPKAVSKLEIRYVLGEKYVVKNPVAMHITEDAVLIALEAKGQIGVDDVVVQKNVRIERSSLSAILVSDAKTGYSSVIYFNDEVAKEFTHGHSRDILSAEYIFN